MKYIIQKIGQLAAAVLNTRLYAVMGHYCGPERPFSLRQDYKDPNAAGDAFNINMDSNNCFYI